MTEQEPSRLPGRRARVSESYMSSNQAPELGRRRKDGGSRWRRRWCSRSRWRWSGRWARHGCGRRARRPGTCSSGCSPAVGEEQVVRTFCYGCSPAKVWLGEHLWSLGSLAGWLAGVGEIITLVKCYCGCSVDSGRWLRWTSGVLLLRGGERNDYRELGVHCLYKLFQ